jgi:hypothetical protein
MEGRATEPIDIDDRIVLPLLGLAMSRRRSVSRLARNCLIELCESSDVRVTLAAAYVTALVIRGEEDLNEALRHGLSRLPDDARDILNPLIELDVMIKVFRP